MIELTGKYSKDCKIFSDKVEEGVISQVMGVLNHPAFENIPVRIMPDNHVGAGCVIGFTAKVSDKIIPNLIGVDIGCGMLSHIYTDFGDNLYWAKKLDDAIRTYIPSGCSVRNSKCRIDGTFLDEINDVCKRTGQDFDYVHRSFGTLGGGNHFIEAGKLDNNDFCVTFHSGSRNFGLKIALYYQKIAQEKNPSYGKDLAWLEGKDATDYLHDMRIAQRFAKENREQMLAMLLNTVNFNEYGETIESVHNFIDDDGIIRKGAISAKKDEMVIIPWNMRDGLIIGKGKGNTDWNNSAPHGAGRVLSRSKAKEKVTLEEYKKSMEGIYSTCVNQSTIDESPMAYKPKEEIEQYLHESVEIVDRVKPFYNFKASE